MEILLVYRQHRLSQKSVVKYVDPSPLEKEEGPIKPQRKYNQQPTRLYFRCKPRHLPGVRVHDTIESTHSPCIDS